MVLGDPLGAKSLVRKAHIHYGGRVAFGGGQVQQPAISQQVNLAAVEQLEFFDKLADLAAAFGQFVQESDVNFVVEVAAVANKRAVFQLANLAVQPRSGCRSR